MKVAEATNGDITGKHCAINHKFHASNEVASDDPDTIVVASRKSACEFIPEARISTPDAMEGAVTRRVRLDIKPARYRQGASSLKPRL